MTLEEIRGAGPHRSRRRRRHDPRPPEERRAPGRPGRRTHHRRRRQTPAPAARACSRAAPAASRTTNTSKRRRSSSSSTPPRCCTTTWSMARRSAAAAPRPTTSSATRRACWSGDFVYSRAFQMMATVGSQRVMEIMADATNVIAEGEVLQLMNAHDPETTEQRYLEVIYRKTGAAVRSRRGSRRGAGGRVRRRSRRALARYGKHLGTAYQLIDDVLDYRSDPATRGKNLGDDLAEGKPTLPLIHALRHGNDEQRALIRLAIEQGGLAQLGPDRRSHRGHGRSRLRRRLRAARNRRRRWQRSRHAARHAVFARARGPRALRAGTGELTAGSSDQYARRSPVHDFDAA